MGRALLLIDIQNDFVPGRRLVACAIGDCADERAGVSISRNQHSHKRKAE
jgi:nicotinamidase-related amidase